MPRPLLPILPAGLLVQQTLLTADGVSILTEVRSGAADCPGCAMPSRRVHSYYLRSLGDLPWQGRAVTLLIQARRFRCLNPDCLRRIFAERLGEVASSATRRNRRLDDLQRCVAWRLAERPEHGWPSASPWRSARTRCCGTRATARGAMPPATPRVLGVDDWAWRQGHHYGTALVDLERNDVVDLLPDRQAATLAA